MFTGTHPWRTFLGAAFATNALCFALVRLIPRAQVEFGAALDVAITVSALYLLLIVRAGLAPAITVAPLFLLGLLRATWLAPGFGVARPLISAAAEIAIGTLLVVRVRRGLRVANGGDLLECIESAAREVVPSRRLAAVLAGELSIFWYAFASCRRAPDVPRGARAFTLHRQSGVATLFGFLAGISLMEAALVHLLVARWSVTAAWVLTCLSVYGALWLAAVARSFVLRPVLVTTDEIVLRAGLLWTVRIPFSSITTERPGASCDLRVPILADPNVVLRLAEPAIARGLYGITRNVTRVAIALDDPSAFIRLF